MKKFSLKHIVIAFIFGALVMVSGQAFADTVSQIGKKVDSEAAVYINGERVSDAIIIQGKSYVPGRDVAETLGATVEWKGSEGIVITSNNIVDWNELQKVSKLKADVEMSKNNIERLQAFIDKHNEGYVNQYSEQVRDLFLKEVEKAKVDLENEKAKLAQYEKELQELESTK